MSKKDKHEKHDKQSRKDKDKKSSDEQSSDIKTIAIDLNPTKQRITEKFEKDLAAAKDETSSIVSEKKTTKEKETKDVDPKDLDDETESEVITSDSESDSDDDSESSGSEEDSETDDDSDDDDEDSDDVSMTTNEILENDPLYFVLSNVFVSKNGRNIADILEDILERLKKTKS